MKQTLLSIVLIAVLLSLPVLPQRTSAAEAAQATPARPAAPDAKPRYNVIDLGSLGGHTSNAYSLNDKGQVVGISGLLNGDTHAFLWDDGTMTDLGALGGQLSFALDINDSGQVVGEAHTANDGEVHAFLWQNGGMQDLGTFGGYGSSAWGINNAGQVVGSAQNENYYHAFAWQNGSMQDLGTLGGWSSYAYAINDAGQIVGLADLVGSATAHAFLWQNGSMQDLGALEGDWSQAEAINNNGQVVGLTSVAGGWHAFLWQNGSMQDLGGTQSSAFDINNAGLIVGESGGRAVLWENSQMKDLNSLIPVDSGWVLQSARAINNKGQIVGKGSFNGQIRAFLISPQAYYWANPSGGAWHLATNWDPQSIPGAGDNTIFDLSGEYTVDAAAVSASVLSLNSFSIDRMVIASTGTVNFNNLNLNLNYDSLDEPSLQVNDGGTANVNSGAATFSHAIIGGAPPANPANPPTAHLQVFNSGTSLNGTGRLTIGAEGAGELFVANGGQLTSAEARLGGVQPGSAVVGGDGSLWETGSIAVGYAGEGTLTIENGGRVQSDTARVDHHARVLVEGGGSIGNQRSQWVVGESLTIENNGDVDVMDGAQLTVNQHVFLRFGSLNVQNSSAVQTTTNLVVQGDVVVGGAGAELRIWGYGMGQIHGNLLVGRDGGGSVGIYERNDLNPDDTGLWVGGGSGGGGLCQIGDEFSGIMGVSTVVLCRQVVIGGTGTDGTGYVEIGGSGNLMALELVRVGQMVGGAPALVEMSSDAVWEARMSGDAGVYIGPSGVVSGTGVISAGGLGLVNDGVLGPGIQVIQVEQAQVVGEAQASPATLTITGPLTNSPTGRLEISLSGSNPGQYGSLGVTGAATLDGVLALVFRYGYAPQQGDIFTFLTATEGISGTFDSVEISGLMLGFEYELTILDGQARLEALNDGVPLIAVFLPVVMG